MRLISSFKSSASFLSSAPFSLIQASNLLTKSSISRLRVRKPADISADRSCFSSCRFTVRGMGEPSTQGAKQTMNDCSSTITSLRSWSLWMLSTISRKTWSKPTDQSHISQIYTQGYEGKPTSQNRDVFRRDITRKLKMGNPALRVNGSVSTSTQEHQDGHGHSPCCSLSIGCCSR